MIRSGDQFDFLGLPDQEGAQDGEGRVLTILGVATSGSVSYRIDMPGREAGIGSIRYTDVDAMIANGIWARRA